MEYKVIAAGEVPDIKFLLDPLRDGSMSIVDKEREISILLTVKGAELISEGEYDLREYKIAPRKVLVASINHSGLINHPSFMLEGTLNNSLIDKDKLFLAFAGEKGVKHYKVCYEFITGKATFSES